MTQLLLFDCRTLGAMGSGNGFGCRPACHLSPTTIAESVGIPRRFAGEAVRTVTDDEKGRQLWRRLAVLTLTLAVYLCLDAEGKGGVLIHGIV